MQESLSFPRYIGRSPPKKSVFVCACIILWLTRLMVQISTLPHTNYGQVICYFSIAALQVTPKLSGLKQQQLFYYFSQLLWVGSLGSTWLAQCVSYNWNETAVFQLLWEQSHDGAAGLAGYVFPSLHVVSGPVCVIIPCELGWAPSQHGSRKSIPVNKMNSAFPFLT